MIQIAQGDLVKEETLNTEVKIDITYNATVWGLQQWIERMETEITELRLELICWKFV